jgi:phage/plasmid-associated DNA primase
MIQRGGFSQSETTQAAMMEFREMTDPLAAWLDRCTVLSPEQLVSRKDLLISYNAQAETSGRPAMTGKAFCQAIRRLRPTVDGGSADGVRGYAMGVPGARAGCFTPFFLTRLTPFTRFFPDKP